MKATLKYIMMIMVAMLATACAEKDEPQAEETVAVEIKASMLGMEGSRSNATDVDELHYTVYKANATEIGAVTKVVGSVKTKNADGDFYVKLNLVKNQYYQIVFWAQNKDCKAYNLTASNGQRLVEIDYTKELTDAFWGKSAILFTNSSMSVSVDLKRPFAQLNIKAKDANDKDAKTLNIKKVEVSVSSYANVLNLVTEERYTAEVGPLTIAKTNVTIDADKNIFSQYVLPVWDVNIDDPTIGVKVVGNAGDEVVNVNVSVPKCPLNANYRTNIILPIYPTTASAQVKTEEQ